MKPAPQHANRHDPAEDWSKAQPIGWIGRSPVTIVTHGCPAAQDDHLIGLQSAVARGIRFLINFEIRHLRMPRLTRRANPLRQLF